MTTITLRSALRPMQRGFSMVEVLISVVVLSFGVLGMVGLQVTALSGSREARLQATGVILARELADLLRGNKDIALKTIAADNPYLGDFSGAPLGPSIKSSCLMASSGCPIDPLHPEVGQTEVGRAEMTDWLSRVEEQLPGARAAICFDSKPFDSQGLPQWACTPDPTATLVIKLGWTTSSTDRSSTNKTPIDRATRPSIVLPVAPGSEV